MEKLKAYQEANKQRFLDELLDLLRIPSVSADSKFEGDVLKTAEFIKEKLIAAGAGTLLFMVIKLLMLTCQQFVFMDIMMFSLLIL